MKVLVTGGSGFIGLSLAHHLAGAGHAVTLFDLKPPPPALRKRLGHPDLIEMVEGSVLDAGLLDNLMAKGGFTHVVHGAAITAGLAREAVEGSRIFEVNLIGTINILEACCRHGIDRLVHLGSGSVYGASVRQEGCLDPVADPAVPDSLYGISKLAAERAVLRYRATRGLDAVVARIGVAFGPWEYDTGLRDTMSIPFALLALARRKEPARILSRIPDDWVHSTDVAEALGLLLDAAVVPQPIYQISGGRRWDIGAWCAAMRELFPDFTCNITVRPEDANVGFASPVARPPFSIRDMKRDFGWSPRYVSPDCLEELSAWHDWMSAAQSPASRAC